MKALLGIAILVVCVHLIAAAPVVVKRLAEKPDLSQFNALRHEAARAGGFKLTDLTYDFNLEAVANRLDGDCEKLAHAPNYRIFPEGPDDNAAKLVAAFYANLVAMAYSDDLPLTADQRRDVDRRKKEMEYALQNQNGTVLQFEVFNPLQTKIGCALSECTGVIPSEIDSKLRNELGIVGDTYSFNTLCVIGPSGSWPKDLSAIHQAEQAALSSESVQNTLPAEYANAVKKRHAGGSGGSGGPPPAGALVQTTTSSAPSLQTILVLVISAISFFFL